MAAMMILMVALLFMGAHHGVPGTHGAHDAAQTPPAKEQPAQQPAAPGEDAGAAAR